MNARDILLELVVGAMLNPGNTPEADAIVDAILAEPTLSVKIATTRKTASSAPPQFSTGDDDLDAFMRRSWKPSDAVAATRRRQSGIPARSTFPFGLKVMTKAHKDQLAQFNDMAIDFWKRSGATVRIDPIPGGGVAIDGRNVTVIAP